jgi:hypothetical protein
VPGTQSCQECRDKRIAAYAACKTTERDIAYRKAYRIANKERLAAYDKAYQKAYHKAHEGEIAAHCAAYYQATKAGRVAWQRAYNKVNRERKSAYNRAWHKRKKEKSANEPFDEGYYEATKEEIAAAMLAYYEAYNTTYRNEVLAYIEAHKNEPGFVPPVLPRRPPSPTEPAIP